MKKTVSPKKRLLSRTAYIQSAAVSTILLDIRAFKFPVGSAGTFNGTSS